MEKINYQKNRKKRSYTTTKYSEDMINIALEALKKKTISSYEAEKVFGIPRRTLLDKLHNKHPNRPGCPTRLHDEEEANIIKVLIAAADYGSPLTLLDLRIVVHRYLEANGRLEIFNNKLPGKKLAYNFVKRNKSKLTYRVIQNIKRSRAEKNQDEMKEYFRNLKTSLEGVPSENLINYDETNLTDNHGAQKCLFKRGVKYPERVLNFTKGAISIMFAITAGGECLPPYVVYKADHLYSQWTINRPKGSRFNRSKSGWFDSFLFEDWFQTIILPWAKNKSGTKVVIGDNLASHLNYKIVSLCEQNDIRFVFLPPNSSHLTQPLDVCYFGPLKKLCREILLNYKIKNPREATINKGHFPDLLKKMMEKLNEKTHNIKSAFKSTGIAPFNPDKVIKKLPGCNQPTMTYAIDNALLDWLKENRSADPNKKVRNKKLNVPPGKSVSTDEFKDLTTQFNKAKKTSVTAYKIKKTKGRNSIAKSSIVTSMTLHKSLSPTPPPEILTEDNNDKFDTCSHKPWQKSEKQKEHFNTLLQVNSDSLLQSSLELKTPNSLNKLCVAVVNTHLSRSMQGADISLSQASNVHLLSELSKNDEANIPFTVDLPKCLEMDKIKLLPKCNIISNIIIQPVNSQIIQHGKQEKTNIKKKQVATGTEVVTRSALHMNLIAVKKEKFAEQRKVLKETTTELKNITNLKQRKVLEETEIIERKPKDESKKRKHKAKKTTKAKKVIVKRRKKRFSCETSLTSSNSDIEIFTADTDDSEYETMDDYISACLKEEQENIEPSIPYGISDIEYFTDHDNKLKADDWILAKFVTKKSVKHFVGKVLSIKSRTPEVKFVRKVKQSKFNNGAVFTYPRVDDICTMSHLDDVILLLPEPKISRRGQIIFNMDLSNYNIQ